jgi:hypothetical protein
MVPENAPLVALAQQGVEAAGNIVVATPSAENRRGEPSISNRSKDRAKRARSKAVSSAASGNRHLADNDARWRVTQNRRQREYDREFDNLRNIIDD